MVGLVSALCPNLDIFRRIDESYLPRQFGNLLYMNSCRFEGIYLTPMPTIRFTQIRFGL